VDRGAIHPARSAHQQFPIATMHCPPRFIAPVSAALLTLACLLPPMLSGCAGIEKDKQATALLASTNGYREALRWGYWQAAVEFLHPEARAQADLAPLENVRVTGIEVLRPATITPEAHALRLVRIDYVLEDEQRVKQVIDRQDWRWDQDRKVWLLHSGLPPF
jgi:hypothetical protein